MRSRRSELRPVSPRKPGLRSLSRAAFSSGWGGRRMRYPASEKLEIIRTVETSHLPVRRTLDKIGNAVDGGAGSGQTAKEMLPCLGEESRVLAY